MDFVQVDVFADGPYRGNPLAVLPDAGELDRRQMQSIASEMNLSETIFVIDATPDSYTVRIFTPRRELAFAGHPTLGAAWVLREAGVLKGDEAVQRSPAGETDIGFRDGVVWFRRRGDSQPNLKERDHEIESKLAKALGLQARDVGLEPRELGRSVNRLSPAFADAGIAHLMIPLADPDALARCKPVPDLLEALSADNGGYCFTALRAGALRARGFYPAFGIPEDPATGSAVACLGAYLRDRIGDIELVVEQGVEMGRPSQLRLRVRGADIEVGGRCELVLKGTLVTLP